MKYSQNQQMIDSMRDIHEVLSDNISPDEYLIKVKGVRHYVVIAPDMKKVIEKEIFAMAHSF